MQDGGINQSTKLVSRIRLEIKRCVQNNTVWFCDLTLKHFFFPLSWRDKLNHELDVCEPLERRLIFIGTLNKDKEGRNLNGPYLVITFLRLQKEGY